MEDYWTFFFLVLYIIGLISWRKQKQVQSHENYINSHHSIDTQPIYLSPLITTEECLCSFSKANPPTINNTWLFSAFSHSPSYTTNLPKLLDHTYMHKNMSFLHSLKIDIFLFPMARPLIFPLFMPNTFTQFRFAAPTSTLPFLYGPLPAKAFELSLVKLYLPRSSMTYTNPVNNSQSMFYLNHK